MIACVFASSTNEGFKALKRGREIEAGLQKRAPMDGMDRYNYLPEEQYGRSPITGRRRKSSKKKSCFSFADDSDNEWEQTQEETPVPEVAESSSLGPSGKMTSRDYKRYYMYKELPPVEYFQYKNALHLRRAEKALQSGQDKEYHEHIRKAEAAHLKAMTLMNPDPNMMLFCVNHYEQQADWMKKSDKQETCLKGVRAETKQKAWKQAYEARS